MSCEGPNGLGNAAFSSGTTQDDPLFQAVPDHESRQGLGAVQHRSILPDEAICYRHCASSQTGNSQGGGVDPDRQGRYQRLQIRTRMVSPLGE